jgi:hypothetical protein
MKIWEYTFEQLAVGERGCRQSFLSSAARRADHSADRR